MGDDVILAARKKAARAAAFVRRRRAFDAHSPNSAAMLLQVLDGCRGVPVAGYMPINTEIDPRPAMANALQNGPVGVPVIVATAAPLQFAQWAPDMAMVKGAFGAQIPANPRWMVPQIVIVPLVAWDLSGGRLGYGGGFYDRTLQGLRQGGDVLAIGFAFNVQRDDNLPLESTDQPLDMIVTEDQVIEF